MSDYEWCLVCGSHLRSEGQRREALCSKECARVKYIADRIDETLTRLAEFIHEAKSSLV